ncbi:MAG TPA: family 20 glycosylhydrolase [Vicinamibacteria bacterium]|nr:family 20 glycosylhydrolase [Vicinamibacteria bacterium]
MRHALPALILALVASPIAAQTALQLRWELKEDVFRGPSDRGSARAAFTITNRDAKALPGRGWAIYFSALHEPRPGSADGGVVVEHVDGDLWRIVPGPGFAGVAPGQSVEAAYLTDLLTNNSFAPVGPYLVLDAAPDKGYPLSYSAVPFERPSQAGHDPRLVTPERQFELDAATRDVPLDSLPPVFPSPVSVEKHEGRLSLAAPPVIRAAPELQAEAAFAAEYLRPHVPQKTKGAVTASVLHLETGKVEGQASPEAYELLVDPAAGIRIVGRSPAGVFYGLQSLRDLLPVTATGKGVSLPALRVVDAPRFGYRGFFLDVARNFQPKASVLRVLDLMARYKLNVFHLHLTDDEGWRIEIPGLPELTSVGARRGHTLDSSLFLPPAWGSGPDVDRPYGSGFFSRADYAEILKYAEARHIEVVPEIEMPGHARAAIKSMEARFRSLSAKGDLEGAGRCRLADPDDRSSYTSAQLYHDNVMNPALESTYAFVERVVQGLVDVHREAGVPLRNLHMGGDEVPGGVWQRSPAAAAFLKEKGLASVDDLWYVFYGRVADILKAHGIPLSGWEEIGLRKTRLDGRPKMIPNPTFAERGFRPYVWNNVPGEGAEDLAYRLANGGYTVVLSPVTNVYFDLAWNQNPEETGLDWGGYVDLRKPFEFVPFDYYRNARLDRSGNPIDRAVFVGKDRLTDYGRSNVLGIQGNLWSETLNGEGKLDYKLLPKLFGLAERAWAPDPAWAREADAAKADALFRDAWSEFVNVVGKRELARLDRESPPWAYRIPKPGLKVVEGQVRCSLEVPGFVLRYTTDGSEPTPKSPEVRGGIPAARDVRVAAFDTNGRRGHTARLAAP